MAWHTAILNVLSSGGSTSTGIYNVRDYGGTAYATEAAAHAGNDVVPAVTSAIAAAQTSPGFGIVYIPGGYYRSSGTINGANHIPIYGAGIDDTIIVRDDIAGDGITLAGGNWDNTKTDLATVVNQSDRTVNFLTAVPGGYQVGQDCKISGGTMTSFGVTDKMPSFISRIEQIVNGATTANGVNALNSATVNVVSTAGFAYAGSFLLGGVATSYTGITGTAFTGCGNHAATTGGEAITSFGITFAEAIPWGQYPLADGVRPTTVSSSNAGLWTGITYAGFTLRAYISTPTSIPANATTGVRISTTKDMTVSIKLENFASQGFGGSDNRNILFTGCHLYRITSGSATGAQALYQQHSTRIRVLGNYFFRCGQGVTMHQSVYGQTIDNSISAGSNQPATSGVPTDDDGRGIKYLAGHAFGIISNNVLSDDAANSIRIADGNNNTISANILHHAAGFASAGNRALQLDANTSNDGTFCYDNLVLGNTVFWSGSNSIYTNMPRTTIAFNFCNGANKLAAGVADTYINADYCRLIGNDVSNYGTGNYGLYVNTGFGHAYFVDNRVSNGGSGTAIRTSNSAGSNYIGMNFTEGESNSFHATDTLKIAQQADQIAATSTNYTPNASNNNIFTVSFGAAVTINAPTQPTLGRQIMLDLRNTSAGALTPTFNVIYKLQGAAAPAIGAGKGRTFGFYFDGTNWIEAYRAAADI